MGAGLPKYHSGALTTQLHDWTTKLTSPPAPLITQDYLQLNLNKFQNRFKGWNWHSSLTLIHLPIFLRSKV